MAAVTPKFKFGFKLVEGKPNLHAYPEKSSQAFHAGDLVKISGGQIAQFTTPSDTTKTSTVSSGIFGVAAKDAENDTANAYTPVYVITPEQVWAVHAHPGKKPSTKATLDEGKNVKLVYSASTAWTLSNGTTTNTTTVAGWYAKTSAASAGKGAIIAGYPDRVGGVKGEEILVRFGRLACDAGY